jgi:predicted RNA-binding Zn ribbon-like protein
MIHSHPTLHVTQETKLLLPVEVELEPADSRVEDGQRVYRVGFFSNETLIARHTGCLLEKLRYRFFAGNKTASNAILSPWACRDEFLRERVALHECDAGLSFEKVGRGKAASMIPVRPTNNPVHSWALGPHGVIGSYVLARSTKSENQDGDPLNPAEISLREECSGWRALLRDALQMDYADWKQLASKYPAEWVSELLAPLPLTIAAIEGAPMARVVCQSLLDVLIVTTQLDGIRGLRWRVCKAEGCDELFLVRNYDHKIYCNYECAHRQAVKDGRRRKREAIDKAKKKSNKVATKVRTAK